MNKNDKFNIEDALKRLSDISDQLSSSDSLNNSLALYDEAKLLIQQCNFYLESIKINYENIEEVK